MTRKNRKRLVIDANIASSAGTSPATVSLYSRRCLETIRIDEHIAVFSSALRLEWRNHASLLAKQWQVAMQQRGRIEDAEGAEFANLTESACACLSGKSKAEALRKDFHLVQSALATDQILLTNETRLPNHLRSSCASVPELLRIFIANPAVEQEECIEWIKAGAKKEPKRRADRFTHS
jgi:hypothetical protein